MMHLYQFLATRAIIIFGTKTSWLLAYFSSFLGSPSKKKAKYYIYFSYFYNYNVWLKRRQGRPGGGGIINSFPGEAKNDNDAHFLLDKKQEVASL